jgi:redox-sensitive bicupin YhaK (pirin superfamily)
VNLPKAYKMSAPRYQGIAAAQIPTVPLGEGASARVIAGELDGVRGPAKTFTPVNLFDMRLAAGTRVELNLPATHQSALVLLRGDLLVNSLEPVSGTAQLALLGRGGDTVLIGAKTDSVVLALSGEPIGEPVASRGPFVMNTEAELRQAMEDYRAGRMGHLAYA